MVIEPHHGQTDRQTDTTENYARWRQQMLVLPSTTCCTHSICVSVDTTQSTEAATYDTWSQNQAPCKTFKVVYHNSWTMLFARYVGYGFNFTSQYLIGKIAAFGIQALILIVLFTLIVDWNRLPLQVNILPI